jgi:HEAT repeat protein
MRERASTPQQFLDSLALQPLESRRKLMEELARHPTEQSIVILVEVLQGDSWYLRDLAVRALARIGAPAAPRLRPVLQNGLWYGRAAAARVLGRIAYADALPDLVQLLADPNHTVQGAVLASLADLVRAGYGEDVARLFWNQGARRAETLNRLLLAVHPDAGGTVAEYLADPASLLARKAPEEETLPAAEEARSRQKA